MKLRFQLFLSLITFFCLFSSSSIGQTKQEGILKEASILILQNKNDSAQILLAQSDNIRQTEIGAVIYQIASSKNVSYSSYRKYFRAIRQNQEVNYNDLFDAYERWLVPPKSSKLNLNYVECLWYVSSKIIDDGNIDLAGKVQKDLNKYMSAFSGNDRDLQKARIFQSLHELTIMVIQRNGDKGLKMTDKLVTLAKETGDVNLIICAKYYKCEFLVILGDLEEFIRISRECYQMDRKQTQKSDFYTNNLVHLIDALIYQKGNDQEVLQLLNEMYEHPDSKLHSYSLYAKLLNTVGKDSPIIVRSVFEQFKVSNIIEFVDKIESESKDVIPPIELYYLLLESARALIEFDEPEVAVAAMSSATSLNRSIYSKELANSLADRKTEKIRLESEAQLEANELKVANEKFQSKIYIGAGVIVFIFLCIAIIALWRQLVQSRLLKSKNDEISEKNLMLEKQSKEKTLFVKEIHHRVKNNFQIITSLLELQTKGIEDKRALELAIESQRRVRSMAIIHQKLYQKDDMQIELEVYVKELVMEIHSAYSSKKVDFDVKINPSVIFDIDTAIPLGLIINELVTNAFKYGFSTDRENILTIGIIENPEFYSLIVTDNGPGIDESIDLTKVKSIGLHLVKRLTKQLMGEFSSVNENGAKFIVKFKDTKMRLESE